MSELSTQRRWLALYVLCLADLMIVLDSTIVNVALPSIRTDLGFSEASLAWVVNAYLLTFGGFLLLAGRFGDLYGQRLLFLIGIAEFTLASDASTSAFARVSLLFRAPPSNRDKVRLRPMPPAKSPRCTQGPESCVA